MKYYSAIKNIYTICKNRNGLREYYAKGSRSEREKYCMIYHLKQIREYNRFTESKLVVTSVDRAERWVNIGIRD